MRRSGKRSEPGPIIVVRQMEKHEWIMNLPRLTSEVNDRLHEGIDWMDSDPQYAASIFLELIDKYPEHLDAYHHLALTFDRTGKRKEALRIWNMAIDTALNFFPEHFSPERDRLQWIFHENRPFLRVYHSYGLLLLERGQTEKALSVLNNLLTLSPRDNQGARALVIGCHLELGQPQGVLSVCRRFPHDRLDHVVYGKALALFQLGKAKQAKKALDIAVKCYPLIAAELLKTRHRKPRGMDDQRITVGGLDQAYAYWQDHGKYWMRTPGAIDFLRKSRT